MEQLNRFELIIGEKINDVINSKVLVLGLGGVGSYAVEALVRSGVGNIVLVDYDTVDISNLNRQLMTYHNNIGKFKTEVLLERIKSINPNCQVQLVTKKINSENINVLYNLDIDYIIDACDAIEVKKDLILNCKKHNIKLISCMGTGNKLDPSRLKIQDIRKTSYDPIAKILRKFIIDKKINYKVMVVCSDEKPLKISNPIGSTAFVPATAGLLCASFVINDILKEKKWLYDFSKWIKKYM